MHIDVNIPLGWRIGFRFPRNLLASLNEQTTKSNTFKMQLELQIFHKIRKRCSEYFMVFTSVDKWSTGLLGGIEAPQSEAPFTKTRFWC